MRFGHHRGHLTSRDAHTMSNRLTQIATRTGDDGTTGLGDGQRVPKDHLRVQAMGDVDELNSQLGVVLAEPLPDDVREWLTMQRRRSALPDTRGLLVETFPRADKHYMVCYPFEGRLAHQTLGMLLTLSKRILESDRALRRERNVNRNALIGNEAKGKTTGIVGMGGIGADGMPVKGRLDRPGRKMGGVAKKGC